MFFLGILYQSLNIFTILRRNYDLWDKLKHACVMAIKFFELRRVFSLTLD